MKLARIVAAIAIATTMAGAFGATSSTENATDQTPAATTQHEWYRAGDRELQSEQQNTGLQGIPQGGEMGSTY